MKQKLPLLIAVGTLLLAALACGQATPALPTATAVLPTAVPPTIPSPTQPPSGMAELVVKNNSGISVCSVYISPVESESWGENALAENEVIRSGSQREFQIPEGSYDLLTHDCEGNLVAYHMDVSLTGRITWSLDPLERAPLLVVNNSAYEICYLYISPADSDSWGPDWMGENITIPAGDTRTFQVPLGTYDLRADNCDHNPLAVQSGIAIEAAGITWTLSDVTEATLTLTNQTDTPICYVLISPAGSTEWGNNWLGDETIPPGSSYTFRLPAGTYDLAALDCSGQPLSEEVYGQEISGNITWTISP
ncbi:MAG: hypothetical protein RMK65_08270 [Anaerolineae bacterium]|nr:hypothetical protein [Anaerolineae bacterium]MDW7992104.1 hypothetical protein [Anaerolineae bacterium]